MFHYLPKISKFIDEDETTKNSSEAYKCLNTYIDKYSYRRLLNAYIDKHSYKCLLNTYINVSNEEAYKCLYKCLNTYIGTC